MKIILQHENRKQGPPKIAFIANTEQREKDFYKVLSSFNEIDGYTYTEGELNDSIKHRRKRKNS